MKLGTLKPLVAVLFFMPVASDALAAEGSLDPNFIESQITGLSTRLTVGEKIARMSQVNDASKRVADSLRDAELRTEFTLTNNQQKKEP